MPVVSMAVRMGARMRGKLLARNWCGGSTGRSRLEEIEEPDWEKEEGSRERSGGVVISQTVLLGGMAILIFLAGVVALVLLREKDPKDVKILQERLPGRTWEESSIPAVPEESEPIEVDLKMVLEEIEVAVKRFLSAKTWMR